MNWDYVDDVKSKTKIDHVEVLIQEDARTMPITELQIESI